MSTLPASVTVFGPGLLGGSILLALRERHPAVRRVVWARREEALVPLRGLVDQATTEVREAARGAELLILCTPIGSMPGLVESMARAWEPDAVLTDVGSVKGPVDAAVAPLARGRVHWLGSHPMAGSDQSGFGAARADLFEGATTILTPTAETAAGALARLEAFWAALGCRTVCLSPGAHDQAVAAVSHLPHLLAAMLINAVPAGATACAGPGFRDVTRIAGGPAPMWREILLENRTAVLAALEAFQAETAAARRALEAGDGAALEALLDKACQSRRSLV